MDLESGAGLLHRLTSYSPEQEWDGPLDDLRVRHDLTPNDLATIPPSVKGYDDGLPPDPDHDRRLSAERLVQIDRSRPVPPMAAGAGG